MARYNEILVGRYNRFLQKLLQMKGGPPAAQLAGDIQVNLNLFNGNENRYLEGWGQYGVSFTQAAVALNLNAFRLRNPVGSGVIAVVERLAYQQGPTGETDLSTGPATVDRATILTPGARADGRQSSRGTLISSFTNGPGLITLADIILRYFRPSTQEGELILKDTDELVITPGQAIELIQTLANSSFFVTCWWRERVLEESELT